MKKTTEDWLSSAESDLVLLDQLYIDARYPGEMGLLPEGKPTISEAKVFFDLGKVVLENAKSSCK